LRQLYVFIFKDLLCEKLLCHNILQVDICAFISHRGTDELMGVMDKVHIVNSTLGKALGGAAGAYVLHF